jgi:pimeloyl-ACP methyl ester carboxylesterase
MAAAVLVHGAWHGAWCWDGVVADLTRRRISVTAVELPLAGLTADVAAARAAIEAAGPGCVVVGHSYGGVVISLAAAGLPAVRRLVYLAAFMTEPDEPRPATSKLAESLRVDERGVTVDPAAAPALFYGDADPVLAAQAAARLRPMRVETPDPAAPDPGEPAWHTVPTTFVVCANDQAIAPGVQRQMAARAQTVLEWSTDHSPFLTRPAAVAELIASYVT